MVTVPGGLADLTVIVPAFREGDRLRVTMARVLDTCAPRFPALEVLVVLDGSDPAAERVLQAYCDRGAPLRVLRNGVNRGKGFSVRRGVLEAAGRVVMFTDADLSAPIESIERYTHALAAGADVAIASRAAASATASGAAPRGRRVMSRLFNLAVRAAFVPGILDTQCGFKCFRRHAARELFAIQRIERFAFDVEILWLARRLGYRVVEVPVDYVYYRQTSVHRGLDTFSMLRDLARVRWYHLRGLYPPPRRRLPAALEGGRGGRPPGEGTAP